MAKTPEPAASAASPAAQTARDAGKAAFGMAEKMTQEWGKLFSQMKMPGVPDLETVLAVQRRNIETFTAANRVALEGAQAVARRNLEIVQATMSEFGESMKAIASTDPQARAAAQAEMLKATYERAVSNLRELSDLIQRSNAEAVELLNHRFSEAMDEVKRLAAKSGG